MFAYCRNNPVCRIDVTGYSDIDVEEISENGVDERPDEYGPASGSISGNRGAVENPTLSGSYGRIPGWIATGRTNAKNLYEQIAMKAAQSDPQSGKVIIKQLNDPRLVGYSKYQQVFHTSHGKITIHYVGCEMTNIFDDFKFIDYN